MKLDTLLCITYHYKVGEKEGKNCVLQRKNLVCL